MPAPQTQDLVLFGQPDPHGFQACTPANRKENGRREGDLSLQEQTRKSHSLYKLATQS